MGSAQGRMNRRFLLVAVLLAGLSAALVYAKISANDGGGSGSTHGSTGDVPVVVAKVPIKERTTITAAMVEVRSVSSNAIGPTALTDVTQVIGKVTKFPVEMGQQLVDSAVIDTTRPIAGAALSYVVPTGKRAMSISASQVSNAGGLILPGDWVDIVWSCCSDRPVVTKTLLRNIQVVAVAQTIVPSGPVTDTNPTAVAGASPAAASTGSTNPVAASAAVAVPDATTVTLLLTPAEVQILFLAESNGKLRLDARGVGDLDTPDTGYTIVTQPELLPLEALSGLPDALKPDGYKR
ncbi:MAG: Flp pilus assembly protein CpaB [Chloroflexota bacterium]